MEVEATGIIQLVQSSSDNTVVPNLNETSSFSNVHDVADGKVATLKCDVSSILEDLVPQISTGLVEFIGFLEVDALAFWTNVPP